MNSINVIKSIAKVIAGSRLYGLENESSDTDYKAIFIPDVKELILRRAAHNIHTVDRIANQEYESFSLQSFMHNCATGQDVSIVMMHASQDKIIEDSDTFKYLRDNRKKFYTKRMLGSLGYAKSQAMKYSLRAERMNSVKLAVDKLKELVDRGILKMAQVWDELPENKYLVKGIQEDSREVDQRIWEVSGKAVTANTNPAYALDFLSKLYEKYGDRVRVAASLDTTDWKSVSHAFRVAYQLLHIYKDGDFEFPLPESDFIKSVKYGKVDFLKNEIDFRLNSLITEVETLAAASDYPDAVDQSWMDTIILDEYEEMFTKKKSLYYC